MKMETKPETVSTWFKVQSYLNALNHVLNAAAAFYMTLYSIRQGWAAMTWHIFLTTVGYQLLMTEAIMTLYAPNSWSYFHSRRTKRHLHWILQSVAAVFIIVGNLFITVIRKTPHFKSAHAVTGNIRLKFEWVQKVTAECSRLDFDGASRVLDSSRCFSSFCCRHEESYRPHLH